MRPRTRCTTCAKRHAKCDGMRPVCLECQTHEFSCDWNDKTTADFLFRSENAYADGTARRSRGPGKRIDDMTERQIRDLPSSSTSGNVILASHFCPGNTPQRIGEPLQQPLVEYALAKWSDSISQKTLDLSAEVQIMDVERFLARYDKTLKSVQLRPVLEIALSANALIYFGHMENSPKAILTSRKCYQRALEWMHAPINSTNGNPPDELILTAMLLCSYEVHSGGLTADSAVPNSYIHNDGAAILVGQRTGGSNRSRRSVLLDAIVRSRHICSAVNRFECIIPGLRDSSNFIETPVARMLHEHMVELADLQWQMRDKLKKRSSIEKIIEILRAAQSLGLRMDESHQEYPAYAIRPALEGYAVSAVFRLAREVVATYQFAGPEDASIWLLYQASRVRVNNIIVQLSRKVILHLQTSKDDVQSVLDNSERKLDTLARDIFSAVFSYLKTYVIGDNPPQREDDLSRQTNPVMAGKLVFPLHAVGSCIAVPVNHKRLARDVLMFVARIHCNAVLPELYAPGGIFSIPDEGMTRHHAVSLS